MDCEKVLKNFSSDLRKLSKELAGMEKAQDKAIQLNREVVRKCASAIKLLHDGGLKEAEALLREVELGLSELRGLPVEVSGVYGTALQEFVELKFCLCALKNQAFPAFSSLNVTLHAFLGGAADAAGEFRRQFQLCLLKDDVVKAEYFFGLLNEIYSSLTLLRFSSSLVGDLKRRQDVLRGQIDLCRSELLRERQCLK